VHAGAPTGISAAAESDVWDVGMGEIVEGMRVHAATITKRSPSISHGAMNCAHRPRFVLATAKSWRRIADPFAANQDGAEPLDFQILKGVVAEPIADGWDAET
jgi:hypothetical protein